MSPPPASAGAREHLGDRVEGAIEARADAERQITEGEARHPTRRAVVRAGVRLAIAGVSLYLVAPAVIDTAGSWRRLGALAPGWGVVMVVAQAVSVISLWWLQRIAMHRAAWVAVATSQLAGNGIAKVAPGGGAIGAALQYKLLVQAGMDRGRTVSGLTASNLLTLAVMLALPVLALPALLRGAVDRSLMEAALGGFGIFAVLAVIGAVALTTDEPLRRGGGGGQRGPHAPRPPAPPPCGPPPPPAFRAGPS